MNPDPNHIVAALKQNRIAANRWRTGLALVLLAVVAFYGMRFYNIVGDFDSQTFAERFADKASAMAPTLTANTGEAIDRLLPVYGDEVAKQADQGLIAMHVALSKEIDTLLKDVDLMVDQRATKLNAQVLSGIDAAIASNYPKLAADKERSGQARDAILAGFEGAAKDALDARVKRPSNELKRLIAATAELAKQASEGKEKQANTPELRMVIAMLGMVSRELANGRARLIEEMAK